jgi:hypothetical protein
MIYNQSILSAFMKITQWKPFVQLIYADF